MTTVALAGRDVAIADLAQAVIPLTAHDAEHLASKLQLEPSELTRPLTPHEMEAWQFYCVSAQSPRRIWNEVAALIEQHKMPLHEVAQILGMRPAHLEDALSNPDTQRVLSYETAQMLTGHLKLSGGPLALIPQPQSERRDDPTR